MKLHLTLDANIRSMLAAVRAEVEHKEHPAGGPVVRPFVTISRQAGAGGQELARRLAELLNARHAAAHSADRHEHDSPDAATQWTVWDHELVEKVAAEQHIAPPAVEEMEEAAHPWLQDLLAGMRVRGDVQGPDEFKVYRGVAATVRSLAAAGRAVIVGRGGVFLTRDLPGGVHVRLVAPRDARVKAAARALNASAPEAARWVDHVDQARNAFCKRFWEGNPSDAETFTATLNTAELTDEQMAAAIAQLVRSQPGAARERPGIEDSVHRGDAQTAENVHT